VDTIKVSRGKFMSLVKVVIILIITVSIFAETKITATEYTQSSASIDALADAIASYNHRLMSASNHQFLINSQLQELYTQLEQAESPEEIEEIENESNRLQYELISITREINALRIRINEAEIQLADYIANLDVSGQADYYDTAVSDTAPGTAIVGDDYSYYTEPEPATGLFIAGTNIEQDNTIVVASIVVGIAGLVAFIVVKIINSRKLKWIKTVAVLMILASIGGVGMTVVSNVLDANATRQNTIPTIFVLERNDMELIISTSGVIQSSETIHIFSTQTSSILEVNVEVGDHVREGDILAYLDMSHWERELEQAELNLKNAITSATEEVRVNENAITNAQRSLESARISLDRQQLAVANLRSDLQEAEEDMLEPFDSSDLDRRIEDARLNVERRTTDVNDALQDLNDAIYDFDDFVFVNAITEARVNLNRLTTTLEEAEAELEEERNYRPEPFDAHVHQNNIDDAQRALDISREDRDAANELLNDAEWRYWMISSTPDASHADVVAASNAANTARMQYEAAQRAVENAEIHLERARTNLTRARDEYNRRTSEGRDNIISALESAVDRAVNNVDDARRTYERHNSELERARDNALEHAENQLTRARNNLTDAITAYERLLSDRERAMDDFTDRNTTRLENIQRQYSDALTQLRAAKNNVRSAEDALNQARRRPVTADTTVEIQQINIERILSELENRYIRATADGVITHVNAHVGAIPTGVLFVIEDIKNLYISSNVREHRLVDLYLGQRGHVTTLATGDREFDAEIIFISPRAVSPAGSTSVEFEIRAALDDTDTDVRIGMNAFLNIIIDARENVFSIPLSALVTTESGSFIYFYENDDWHRLYVATGLRTSTHIEVYGDRLREGMNILVTPLNIVGR